MGWYNEHLKKAVEAYPCPKCGVAAGTMCVTRNGTKAADVHVKRYHLADEDAAEPTIVSVPVPEVKSPIIELGEKMTDEELRQAFRLLFFVIKGRQF
jgi:hypothetical protein